ncbi:hypothetical protein Sste5344_006880 [Sporothrix stenoceras]
MSNANDARALREAQLSPNAAAAAAPANAETSNNETVMITSNDHSNIAAAAAAFPTAKATSWTDEDAYAAYRGNSNTATANDTNIAYSPYGTNLNGTQEPDAHLPANDDTSHGNSTGDDAPTYVAPADFSTAFYGPMGLDSEVTTDEDAAQQATSHMYSSTNFYGQDELQDRMTNDNNNDDADAGHYCGHDELADNFTADAMPSTYLAPPNFTGSFYGSDELEQASSTDFFSGYNQDHRADLWSDQPAPPSYETVEPHSEPTATPSFNPSVPIKSGETLLEIKLEPLPARHFESHEAEEAIHEDPARSSTSTKPKPKRTAKNELMLNAVRTRRRQTKSAMGARAAAEKATKKAAEQVADQAVDQTDDQATSAAAAADPCT